MPLPSIRDVRGSEIQTRDILNYSLLPYSIAKILQLYLPAFLNMSWCSLLYVS